MQFQGLGAAKKQLCAKKQNLVDLFLLFVSQVAVMNEMPVRVLAMDAFDDLFFNLSLWRVTLGIFLFVVIKEMTVFPNFIIVVIIPI
eukprot:12778729-Ditylum_brightwellii.AAC.1